MFQRIKLKLGKAKLDLSFLQNCKKQSVIRFLHFKIANRCLQNSTAYCQCQRKLLQEEIYLKQLRIRILSSQSNAASLHLSSLVSSLDLIHLKTLSDHENIHTLNRHQKIQGQKLFRLRSQSKTTDSLNPDVIFNFSQCLSTNEEKDILSKGLNFSLPPSHLDYCDFLAPFEMFYQRLNPFKLFCNCFGNFT